MKNIPYREIVHLLIALVVGAVFVYAGWVKIVDPDEFAQSIKYYKILPLWAVNVLALLLPWWEVLAGVAIIIPAWRQSAAGIIFVLTCIFTIAISSALYRGLDISCGCFSTQSEKAGVKTLTLDVGILLATGYLLWEGSRRRQVLEFLPSQSAETLS